MAVTVNGKTYEVHDVVIENDRMLLMIPMGLVTSPVVNGVEYTEYEYRELNGIATLVVPMGDAVALPPSADPRFRDPEIANRMSDAEITQLVGPSLAPIIVMDDARGKVRPHSRLKTGASRTNFTRKPLNY